MSRSVKKIIAAQKVNMGGHILDQPLPVNGIDQIDPFLLIHHWKRNMKGGDSQKDVGVGPHPHRGFSPVTFVFEGAVEHRDSLGNRATVTKGGTQWMHAGKGITHSERPSKTIAEEGGLQEFIQFWVNTPAALERPIIFPFPMKILQKFIKALWRLELWPVLLKIKMVLLKHIVIRYFFVVKLMLMITSALLSRKL